jgi:hypothetical protein
LTLLILLFFQSSAYHLISSLSSRSGVGVPYVQRDPAGKILALWKEKQDGLQEFVSPDSPEVLSFLDSISGHDPENTPFSLASDLQMVRVIEDLINLLITKRMIVLTELPIPVQNKLLRQRAKRESLIGQVSIISESDKSLF